jgi:transposase-like protein
VSTNNSGGHVNAISNQIADGRRRRRLHSAEFKAEAVAACMQAGVSMAAVAMTRGINANLLRRWVRAEEERGGGQALASVQAPSVPAFVPLQLPAATAAPSDIRIELRRGATSISVTWPTHAAAECAAWMRELLR